MICVLEEHIRRQVEVYVDDLVVKSKKENQYPQHLIEVFTTLCKFRIKLNPTKCTFNVTCGKFLGYLVTRRGIEANPNQIQAIQNMKTPTTQKEMQKLAGGLAALFRFISHSTYQCKPIFTLLKKKKNVK